MDWQMQQLCTTHCGVAFGRYMQEGIEHAGPRDTDSSYLDVFPVARGDREKNGTFHNRSEEGRRGELQAENSDRSSCISKKVRVVDIAILAK